MRIRRFCPTCSAIRPVVNHACALCGGPVRFYPTPRHVHQAPTRERRRIRAVAPPVKLTGWRGLSTVTTPEPSRAAA